MSDSSNTTNYIGHYVFIPIPFAMANNTGMFIWVQAYYIIFFKIGAL